MQDLTAVLNKATESDAFRNPLSSEQWQSMEGFLQPRLTPKGEVLFAKGALDRNIFFVEAGTMAIHLEDSKGHVRVTPIEDGGILGECAFFSHTPRTATAQAATSCRLWTLSPVRFADLCNRHPTIALPLTLAFGAVMAKRLKHRTRRWACV